MPKSNTILLTANEVAAMLSISKRTLYRLVKASAFPSPIRIGSSVRWRHAEVVDWINRQ